MKKGVMIRQGDVLMIPVERIPDSAKLEKGRKTVALGEVTGHHHDLQVQTKDAKVEVYTLEDQLFANVDGDVKITHQEHDHLPVTPGLYEIRIQREYSAQEARRVLD